MINSNCWVMCRWGDVDRYTKIRKQSLRGKEGVGNSSDSGANGREGKIKKEHQPRGRASSNDGNKNNKEAPKVDDGHW